MHVQLDLPDYKISVVNTTTNPLNGLAVTARVFSLDNKLLLERQQAVSVAADSVLTGQPLGWPSSCPRRWFWATGSGQIGAKDFVGRNAVRELLFGSPPASLSTASSIH